MQITVGYGARSFGIGGDARNFVVKIEKAIGAPDSLAIGFRFPQHTIGRGTTWQNAGTVHSADLTLSESQARRIALAILCHLEKRRPARTEVIFKSR